MSWRLSYDISTAIHTSASWSVSDTVSPVCPHPGKMTGQIKNPLLLSAIGHILYSTHHIQRQLCQQGSFLHLQEGRQVGIWRGSLAPLWWSEHSKRKRERYIWESLNQHFRDVLEMNSPSFKSAMSFTRVVKKSSWTTTLLTLICFLHNKTKY